MLHAFSITTGKLNQLLLLLVTYMSHVPINKVF